MQKKLIKVENNLEGFELATKKSCISSVDQMYVPGWVGGWVLKSF
jgi:hypothetical protein